MGKKNKDETIAVRVDNTTKKQLTKLAEAQRRTVSDYLRLILTDIAEGKIKPLQ